MSYKGRIRSGLSPASIGIMLGGAIFAVASLIAGVALFPAFLMAAFGVTAGFANEVGVSRKTQKSIHPASTYTSSTVLSEAPTYGLPSHTKTKNKTKAPKDHGEGPDTVDEESVARKRRGSHVSQASQASRDSLESSSTQDHAIPRQAQGTQEALRQAQESSQAAMNARLDGIEQRLEFIRKDMARSRQYSSAPNTGNPLHTYTTTTVSQGMPTQHALQPYPYGRTSRGGMGSGMFQAQAMPPTNGIDLSQDSSQSMRYDHPHVQQERAAMGGGGVAAATGAASHLGRGVGWFLGAEEYKPLSEYGNVVGRRFHPSDLHRMGFQYGGSGYWVKQNPDGAIEAHHLASKGIVQGPCHDKTDRGEDSYLVYDPVTGGLVSRDGTHLDLSRFAVRTQHQAEEDALSEGEVEVEAFPSLGAGLFLGGGMDDGQPSGQSSPATSPSLTSISQEGEGADPSTRGDAQDVAPLPQLLTLGSLPAASAVSSTHVANPPPSHVAAASAQISMSPPPPPVSTVVTTHAASPSSPHVAVTSSILRPPPAVSAVSAAHDASLSSPLAVVASAPMLPPPLTSSASGLHSSAPPSSAAPAVVATSSSTLPATLPTRGVDPTVSRLPARRGDSLQDMLRRMEEQARPVNEAFEHLGETIRNTRARLSRQQAYEKQAMEESRMRVAHARAAAVAGHAYPPQYGYSYPSQAGYGMSYPQYYGGQAPQTYGGGYPQPGYPPQTHGLYY